MQKLLAFLRRRPLLSCSLLANASLAAGWTIEHRDGAALLDEVMQQSWESDGRYVGLMGQWDAAVKEEDQELIAKLSIFAQSLAEGREMHSDLLARQGFDWAE